MRAVGIALILAAATALPASAQRAHVPAMPDDVLKDQLGKGEELETRLDGDLNGDGEIDTVAVGRNGEDDTRKLRVFLGYVGETDMGHDPGGVLVLDPYPVGGPAELSLNKGVLLIKDLTGGTSATA